LVESHYRKEQRQKEDIKALEMRQQMRRPNEVILFLSGLNRANKPSGTDERDKLTAEEIILQVVLMLTGFWSLEVQSSRKIQCELDQLRPGEGIMSCF
jgi:hypothetical protein